MNGQEKGHRLPVQEASQSCCCCRLFSSILAFPAGVTKSPILCCFPFASLIMPWFLLSFAEYLPHGCWGTKVDKCKDGGMSLKSSWVKNTSDLIFYILFSPHHEILQYWNKMSGLNVTIQQFSSVMGVQSMCGWFVTTVFRNSREYDLFSDRNKRTVKPDKARCEEGQAAIRRQCFPAQRLHMELWRHSSGRMSMRSW